jgi:Dipeptidyl aminopeptidases/acylaminoacyl-peptidases
MKSSHRFAFAPLLLALSAVLTVPGGCAAESRQAAAAAASALPTSVPTTLGGVAYDAAAPLNAEAKPLFDESAPPANRSYSLRYAGGGGKTVPALLTIPGSKSDGTKHPCVLLLHGLGGRKEDMLLLGVALARRGYASVAIDIAGHGQREKIGGKPVSDLALPGMREVAGQTVVDLRRAVDYLSTRPDIDASRLGYVGVSLGGIIGGVFVASEPRLKGGVLWAAGGDWGKLITTSQHAFAKKYREQGETDAAKIEAVMGEVDPIRYISLVAPRPLLFLNGTEDTIVPKSCTESLYAAAKDPKAIKYIPGGHVPDLKVLLEDTLTWLDTHVKK